MVDDLDRLVRRFRALRVAVVGDAILDRYLTGRTARLSQEGPVPIVDVAECVDAPGGAGNTAANVAGLGASVRLLGVAGADEDARRLRAALARHGVDARLRTVRDQLTLTKHRLTAGDQLLVRFDHGGRITLPPAVEDALCHDLAAAFADSDAIVVADYGYGVCTPRLITELARLQATAPRILGLDARRAAAHEHLQPTFAKPNYREAAGLVGLDPDATGPERANAIEDHSAEIVARLGARLVAVTLDADGAVALEPGRPAHRVTARPAPPRRAAGAGDTFTAALALALAAGADTVTATEIAGAAAAAVVAKPGTAVCSADELRLTLRGGDKLLGDLDTLTAQTRVYRAQGRRVVLTNGCFDLLHRGHVGYLNRAKLQGDVLVVAVNSDASVRRLKGPDRPVNPLGDRLQVLAALGCVDHVVAFDDDTAAAVLEAAHPHIYVKGGDYTSAMVPEAAVAERLGAEVRILPYVEDRSTTRLISQIRQATSA